MKKPLFAEILEAEEYQYLYTDNDNMNYYSAKQYDDLTDKKEYWRNIPRNEKSDRFWFPLYSDFKYLSDNYNGNIDMDQQSPEFWIF